MSVKTGFATTTTNYGPTSNRLNTPSVRRDARKKGNERYRCGKVKEGKLVKENGQTFILYKDGQKTKIEL